MRLLNDINDFLSNELAIDRYPASEQGGIYKPSERPVSRIGVALEPQPNIGGWVREHQLDALWLHRPWQLNTSAFPADVGVLYHHLPFDETLTTGYNVRLAATLGLSNLQTLGYKTAPDPADSHLPPRPIGMLGTSLPRSFDDWKRLINQAFGGYDRAEAGQTDAPECVAVVGSMNPSLVQEAHERGVGLYLTGEYRKGTQTTVDKTGMAVIAIGHRRTEEWGLRSLANLLREKLAGVDVVVL